MTLNLGGWEKTLSEARTAETSELIKQLGYQAPEYKGDTQLVSKFFSNLDKPVFITSLQGVLSGALMSKHSRTESDLRRWLHDHLRGKSKQPETAARQERMRTAFEKLCIPDFVQEFGTNFYDTIFAEYGDDSIA